MDQAATPTDELAKATPAKSQEPVDPTASDRPPPRRQTVAMRLEAKSAATVHVACTQFLANNAGKPGLVTTLWMSFSTATGSAAAVLSQAIPARKLVPNS